MFGCVWVFERWLWEWMPGCFQQIVKYSVNCCPMALPKYCSEPAACPSLHHRRQRLLFGLLCVPGANCMLVRMLSMPGQRAFNTAPQLRLAAWALQVPLLDLWKRNPIETSKSTFIVYYAHQSCIPQRLDSLRMLSVTSDRHGTF